MSLDIFDMIIVTSKHLFDAFYELPALDGCWSLVSILICKMSLYGYVKCLYMDMLNISHFDCTSVAESAKVVALHLWLTGSVR